MQDTAPSKTDLGYLRVRQTGMVAADLARAIGVSRWRLIRIELGRARATPEEIELLAAAMRLPVADIRRTLKTKD